MNNNTMKITLLTGYLGSGKTTLINHILNNQDGYKIAVIVNDIGEVNIDAALIEKGGVVTSKDDSLVALSNGCICCNLKMDLVKQITDIIGENKFDHIIIEASGICEPIPIAQTITMMNDMYADYTNQDICKLDSIVTVLDAHRLVDEFNCGDSLVEKELDDDDIEKLIIEQVEFCNVIILNKVSDISKNELDKVKKIIKKLQPKAKIIETDYCDVSVKEILDTNLFNFNDAAMSAGWIEALENPSLDDDSEEELEYGISTFVYYRRDPFDRDKFQEFINNLDKSVIRSKGVVYFSDEVDMSYMVETAGSSKNMIASGSWVVDMPLEDKELILRENPSLKRDWSDKYGDRMIKIVFIGKDMDKDKIISKLDEILDF